MKLYVQEIDPRTGERIAGVVYNRTDETHIPLAPGMAFDSDSAIVRDYPWAFEVPLEQATAGPGEKRNVRRA